MSGQSNSLVAIDSSHYVSQIELWIVLGHITFDDLQSLCGSAYAKEESVSNRELEGVNCDNF